MSDEENFNDDVMLSEEENDLFINDNESDVNSEDVYLEDDLFGSGNKDYQKSFAFLKIQCPSETQNLNIE